MKRFIFGIILVFLMITTLNAKNIPAEHKVSFVTVNDQAFEDSDYKTLISEYVPEKYLDAFYYYTACDTVTKTNNLRLQLLAVGEHETGWKPLTSKKNKNGSVDKGYLQLNSDNIKNDWFMWNFGPKEEDEYQYDKEDDLELYLITCIKLYKSLYLKYGDNAAYCYNGGEGRYLRHKLPYSTFIYKKCVNEKLNIIKNRLDEIKDAREYFEDMYYLNDVEEQMIAIIDINAQKTTNTLCDKLEHKYLINYIPDLYNDKKAVIITISISRFKPSVNTDYVFIGYGRIRKTGAVAPVFLNRATGSTEIC